MQARKHYLNNEGSRWYIQINNKSEELIILYEKNQTSTFPYYVVFDEDIGVEEKYSTLKELKEGEDFC